MEADSTASRPAPRARRALRHAGWNALWLAAGLALLAAFGETALRITVPFMAPVSPRVFHPQVGFTRPPHAEVRSTNGLDYWQVSRANRLGFLDREPPVPERAAATCHVSFFGDSFVEARQVPLADKVQVRLEERAAGELPGLDLTTSAFGLGDTGQVQQLAFYDEYVRPLRPKVLVLVLVRNDLRDNSALLRAALRGWDPDRAPEPTAVRGRDGAFAWRPPAAEYADEAPPPRAPSPAHRWVGHSWFVRWLVAKRYTIRWLPYRNAALVSRLDALRRRPEYAELLAGYRPRNRFEIVRGFTRPELAPVLEDALDATRFAFRQFRERAEEIGAAPVALATDTFHLPQVLAESETRRETAGETARRPPPGEGAAPRPIVLARLGARASAAGIPVLDMGAEIRRRGLTPDEVRWPNDPHWNAAGHRLAAEMLLGWLRDNPSVCEDQRRERDEATGASARVPGAAPRSAG